MRSNPIIAAGALLPLILLSGCKSPTSQLREIGDQAKLRRTEADLSTLGSCLGIYRITSGTYPTEEQGLAALVEAPSVAPIPKEWQQVMKAPMVDAWGREYRYSVRVKDGTTEHVVSSEGPDAGTREDDLERVLRSVAGGEAR